MRDVELIQITGAALGDAYGRAGVGSGMHHGEWMACRPGCHQCCIGVFPISALDAARLRQGLNAAPADVREAVTKRAAASRQNLTPGFPGDPATGRLFTEPNHHDLFDDFGNDEPCPVLNPNTQTCDLYAARPLPCRTFGPPMPNDDGGLGVCELCFVGAPPEEVARCTVDAHFLDLEADADAAHIAETSDDPGPTLIAYALTR